MKENNTIEDHAQIEETIESEIAELKKDSTGVIDVIGLDVIRLNNKVDTVEEAKAALEKHTTDTFDILTIGNETYVIKTTLANLNEVNSLIPEDLEPTQAIPIQVKISEILQEAGLDVGINTDTDNVEAEVESKIEIA